MGVGKEPVYVGKRGAGAVSERGRCRQEEEGWGPGEWHGDEGSPRARTILPALAPAAAFFALEHGVPALQAVAAARFKGVFGGRCVGILVVDGEGGIYLEDDDAGPARCGWLEGEFLGWELVERDRERMTVTARLRVGRAGDTEREGLRCCHAARWGLQFRI